MPQLNYSNRRFQVKDPLVYSEDPVPLGYTALHLQELGFINAFFKKTQ